APLPRRAEALLTRGSVGHWGGLLYALNMLGGVFGTVAMGFGLPAMIGVRASYGVAAGASLLAGVGALALSRRQPEARPAEKPGGSVIPAAQLGRLRLVAAGTGALGLG